MASLTYSQIETRVMNRLRIPTSNSTEATKVQAIINDVYRDIYSKTDWWWLVKRSVINTADDISTGTISVTNNSASVTFSSAPAPSVAGRVLLVTDNTTDSGAVYRISAHSAGATAATLDAAYTGSTNTAAAYRVYQDAYGLPTDMGLLRHVKRFGFRYPMAEVGLTEMLDLKTWDSSVGKPQVYAVIDFSTTGDPTTARQLVVHPYPDAIYRLELHYKQTLNTEVSGTTRFLIPDDYIQILEYGALARAFPSLLNNLEKGTFWEGKFNDILALMTAKQREHEGNPGVQPRDEYRRFYNQRRRLNPSTSDLGSYFDRWPSEP